MENRHIIHLYNRFGFGLNASEINQARKVSFEQKLNKEKLERLELDLSDLAELKRENMSKSMRKDLRKKLQEKMAQLNVNWMNQMIASSNMIQEKMNLFWHHHFACQIKNPAFGLQFTNALRENATGRFKDLLLSMAQSGAMINFLHTKQNKKQHPNEDFARELCELFTLGRDNDYTEVDIQEIARCFTGWKSKPNGEFIIQRKQHDIGSKTIFGKTGNFGGEDVIDLILEKKACARFICTNLFEYFVHPVANEKEVAEMTDIFYNSNYNIKKLIIHIAESDWFYKEDYLQSKIKSPVELIVGLSRQFDLRNERKKSWLQLQRILDQTLYMPPNVKGWKVNQEWIDSNSLPLRLRLPSILLTNAELDLTTKPDYDADPNDDKRKNKMTKKLGFSYDWEHFFKKNRGTDFKSLFFNNKISPQVDHFLNGRTFDSEIEEVIQLISLPEYQLV
jgi:uncharacterized protein (DUF1800 family)